MMLPLLLRGQVVVVAMVLVVENDLRVAIVVAVIETVVLTVTVTVTAAAYQSMALREETMSGFQS